MKKRIICIVTHLYPTDRLDYKGGFVRELAQFLHKRGHVVHVVTPMRPGAKREECAEGVRVHRFSYYRWNDGVQLGQLKGTPLLLLGSLIMSGISKCVRITLKYRADILHAYWVVPGGLIAMISGMLTGRPVVATAAGSDLNIAPRKTVTRMLTGLTLRRIDKLISVSTPMKKIAVSLGLPESKGVVIPGPAGIDLSEYRMVTGKSMADSNQIIYVGNMSPPKRVDTIIRAVAKLAGTMKNINLVLVGDGELKPDLEDLADDLGIAPIVRFTGALPHGQAMELLRKSDLFVHCSENEGLPVAIMEAMAFGLPVVASDVGGIPELVKDDETGFTVNCNDSEKFAERVKTLLTDRYMRDTFSVKARRFAEKRLNREKIISENEKIYNGV